MKGLRKYQVQFSNSWFSNSHETFPALENRFLIGNHNLFDSSVITELLKLFNHIFVKSHFWPIHVINIFCKNESRKYKLTRFIYILHNICDMKGNFTRLIFMSHIFGMKEN